MFLGRCGVGEGAFSGRIGGKRANFARAVGDTCALPAEFFDHAYACGPCRRGMPVGGRLLPGRRLSVDFFDGPSFHEGSGSCARAMVVMKVIAMASATVWIFLISMVLFDLIKI